jgi:hypothetical protein
MRLAAHPDVIEILGSEEADVIAPLGGKIGRPIEMMPEPRFHREQFEIGSRRVETSTETTMETSKVHSEVLVG